MKKRDSSYICARIARLKINKLYTMKKKVFQLIGINITVPLESLSLCMKNALKSIAYLKNFRYKNGKRLHYTM